ncbi:MAG: ATP-binding protein, partial [Candidatus Eremiobacterota bacterium]
RIDVTRGLEDTLLVHSHELGGIQLVRDYAPVPAILAFPAELNQVWSNLVANAVAAMKGHGRLTLQVGEAEGAVRVVVADSGPGIPPDHLARIFERGFTTRSGGLGLGLSISRSIVERHGGRIEVDSQPGHTEFRVWLPEV